MSKCLANSPRSDINQVTGRIINAATDPALYIPGSSVLQMPASGKKGATKSGPARAKEPTPAERSEIAAKAARAQWSKEP